MWYKKSYRRNLIDMHISDWNDEFLSKFDPKTYVDMLELAQVDTAYIYTTSCLGLCYWPTRIGKMHAGLNGHDIVGELFDLCRKHDIRVVAYYNNWSLWACQTNPDWQVRTIRGRGTSDYLETPGHYGVCCFNSPYRDFIVAQIKDLCARYDFAGMWFDMGFWPYTVCYCDHCRKRYDREIGGAMPTVINWCDPVWRKFSEIRNQWLVEYTEFITRTAKAAKPGISVGHQCACWGSGWYTGVSQSFFAQSDYLGGDFYGGFADHALCCKLLANLTQDKPFEFMTSRCPDLSEHTTCKPTEQLRTEIAITLAHNGAFFFIDAIDPVGTLDRRVYAIMGQLYGEVRQYEPYLDCTNQLCEDVAVYLNFESMINPAAENGQPVTEEGKGLPLLEEIQSLNRTLTRYHLPFGVITDKNLSDLARHQVILISDSVRLSPREARAIREYVNSGGHVIVLRGTHNLGPTADPETRAIISGILGVEFITQTSDCATYIAPTTVGQALLPDHTAQYPLAVNGRHTQARTNGGAQVLANIIMPYTDLSDPARFASAISNPPGIPTDLPAIVRNTFGQGAAVFVSGTLDRGRFAAQQITLMRLIKFMATKPFTFETDAPPTVQVTALYNHARQRYTLNFVNLQDVVPQVTVGPLDITLSIGVVKTARVLKLPAKSAVVHRHSGSSVSFATDPLQTFLMYQVELE